MLALPFARAGRGTHRTRAASGRFIALFCETRARVWRMRQARMAAWRGVARCARARHHHQAAAALY